MIPLFLLEIVSEPQMNYITTGAIAAVCSAVSGIVLYSKGRQARTVTVEDQPVGIRLEKEFVSRAEFAEFKVELKVDVRDMRGSFDRLATLIDERDRKLTDMIEKVASGAFEGRRRLHDEVNRHREQIAAIGVNTNVSKAVGRLGAAILSHVKHCPVANQEKP